MTFSSKLSLLLLLSSLCIHASLAEIVCEELPNDVCAFSIASSAKRCLLETANNQHGSIEYQCRTSEVVVERMAGYIESDHCVKACGVDRKAVGISSDALLESKVMAKLCSPACYRNCHNIVDLYFNLASGEGVFLPDLCKKLRYSPRRAMVELLSFGGAAPGPVSSVASITSAGSVSGPSASAPAPIPSDEEPPAPAPAPFLVDEDVDPTF